jgi:hypothetical protein
MQTQLRPQAARALRTSSLLKTSAVALLAMAVANATACTSESDEPRVIGKGGSNAQGGSKATGGSNSGGSNASGGTNATSGGTSASGGSSASGGTNAAGGSGNNSSAGSDASGGTSNGGSASVASCGFKNQGTVINVAANIEVCIPTSKCLPETCPPGLGKCVDDKCVFEAGYKGIETLPEAWATHYCNLQTGSCTGVRQFSPPLTNAQNIATKHGLKLCANASASEKCVGIVAVPPMMAGNREKWNEQWGYGYTEAMGTCYEVTGPGGSALVAITDRCGGWCTCPSKGQTVVNECGACSEATDLTAICQCRGSAGSLYDQCASPVERCDWCAANNHPHFDLDEHAFEHVCGDQKDKGSCKLTQTKLVPCMDANPAWPPQ